MTKFTRAYIPQAEVDAVLADLASKPPEWFEPYLGPNPTAAQRSAYVCGVVAGVLEDEIWRNDVYQVHKRNLEALGGLVQLSIKRIDREPCHDWRDFQAIKNELVGAEHEGVELYPAESRLVDTANQYFLFVLADSRARFPFGMNEGQIKGCESIGKSKNRAFNE